MFDSDPDLRLGEMEETERVSERRSDGIHKEYIVTWWGKTEETGRVFERRSDDIRKEYIVTWWGVGWTALKILSLGDQRGWARRDSPGPLSTHHHLTVSALRSLAPFGL